MRAQGPGQDFTRVSIWVKNRDEREGASCSFRNDVDENVISQTMINCLEAPVEDDFALLRWSPDQSSITYRTSFRVVPTKLLRFDIVLGKEWWEDPEVKINCKTSALAEETRTKHRKSESRSPKSNKESRTSDEQSVYSTSSQSTEQKLARTHTDRFLANKSRGKSGHRKTSETKEDKALKKLGRALYQVILDQECSGSDDDDGG